MTDLHNMSVPSRSVLTVHRMALGGRRYRVAIGASVTGDAGWPDDAALTRYFREDGAACALALLDAGRWLTVGRFRAQIARFRRQPDALTTLRQRCETALISVGLPDGFGFFLEETPSPALDTLPAAAAVAILAARSGPLYLPGRFEPSLITAGAVTLFFPVLEARRGVQ
jgi:hypothetical protein